MPTSRPGERSRRQARGLLGKALEWDLPHLERTADDLSRSLPLVGLRLRPNSTGQLSLLSATESNGPAAAAVERLTLDTRGLNWTEAELVTIARLGRLPRRGVSDGSKRIALSRRTRQGNLVNSQPDIRPSPAVEYALDF